MDLSLNVGYFGPHISNDHNFINYDKLCLEL